MTRTEQSEYQELNKTPEQLQAQLASALSKQPSPVTEMLKRNEPAPAVQLPTEDEWIASAADTKKRAPRSDKGKPRPKPQPEPERKAGGITAEDAKELLHLAELVHEANEAHHMSEIQLQDTSIAKFKARDAFKAKLEALTAREK